MRTTPEATCRLYRDRNWWSDRTINDMFRAAAAVDPARLALVDPPNRADLIGGVPARLTFAEVQARVENLSGQLLAAGLEADDIIVVQLPNVHELVLLYLAAASLGIIVSPVPMQYRRHELEQIIKVTNPAGIVTCASFRGFDHAAQASEVGGGLKTLIFGLSAPAGTTALAPENEAPSGRALLEAHRRAHQPAADDILTICWTSGTEGVPKGVPRSHNHWIAISWGHFEGAQIRPGDKLLNPFPLINMAAIGGCFLSWLHSAGTLILHHPFDLKVYLQQINAEQPQYAIAPPAILNMLLKDEATLAGTDLSSLRCIGSGSAPLAPSMVAGYRDRFGIQIVNIFGSNEGVALISGPDDVPDPSQRARFFPRFGRPEVSWPLKVSRLIETRIVEPDTGQEILEPGRPGELLIRGATVFDGYYRAPDLTQRAFTTDGYFRTGDLFAIATDERGPRFYQFLGRCRQLIVRGGMKISPEELDELLAVHPDILEGATVGYHDDVLGERICAVVVPRPGRTLSLDGLKAYFKERDVAVFKWPERLRCVAQLPRNPVGKVVRADLMKIATSDPE